MNREIKFKAKRKDNNEWVYGYYAKTDLGTFINQYRVDYENEYTYCEDFEVIPETVSQYTGLEDKNGIEIYENDKLYDDPNDWHYTVGFQDGIFCLLLDEEIVWDDVYEYKNQCEVIGNKFDNSELLDKEVK